MPVATQRSDTMAETVLLSVGKTDGPRVEELVAAAADVVSEDGRVVVLHAYSAESYDDIAAKFHMDPGEARRPDVLARRNTVATKVAESLEGRGVTAEIRGAIGEKGEVVLRTSETVGADAVVIGGRRRSPSGKALFGSTAQRVLLKADCPVTFVKAHGEAEPGTRTPAGTPEL